MPEIHFPTYRDYVRNRIDVNNSMMALLAGSRMAAHLLEDKKGSTETLSELFADVGHIQSFNLVTDSARDLLINADQHIASVSLPYALATHEAFVRQMIKLIRDNGTTIIDDGERIRAFNMHAVFFASCNHSEPTTWMQIFHVLREARNCIIHLNGGVSPELKTAIVQMGPDARAEWQRMNQQSLPKDLMGKDKRLTLTAEHIFTSFATTKALGREMNTMLGQHLSGDAWARIAVEDYASQTKKPRNSSQWSRGVAGYARQMYSGAPCGKREIEQAARRGGPMDRS